MTLHVKKGTDWKSVYAQARSLAPEAFETDRINNLIMGVGRNTVGPRESSGSNADCGSA